ncbi:MAG: hypothetical protein AAFN04_08875 [Pseudomonadota bacterium]
MYFQQPISHEDKARIVAWSAGVGAFLVVVAWGIILSGLDTDSLLVPTSFTILSLSIIVSDKTYDEFHRSCAYAGAIGGMLAIIIWTAFLPILTDWLSFQSEAFLNAKAEPRVTFFIAATGFYVGFYSKRLRGDA